MNSSLLFFALLGISFAVACPPKCDCVDFTRTVRCTIGSTDDHKPARCKDWVETNWACSLAFPGWKKPKPKPKIIPTSPIPNSTVPTTTIPQTSPVQTSTQTSPIPTSTQTTPLPTISRTIPTIPQTISHQFSPTISEWEQPSATFEPPPLSESVKVARISYAGLELAIPIGSTVGAVCTVGLVLIAAYIVWRVRHRHANLNAIPVPNVNVPYAAMWPAALPILRQVIRLTLFSGKRSVKADQSHDQSFVLHDPNAVYQPTTQPIQNRGARVVSGSKFLEMGPQMRQTEDDSAIGMTQAQLNACAKKATDHPVCTKPGCDEKGEHCHGASVIFAPSGIPTIVTAQDVARKEWAKKYRETELAKRRAAREALVARPPTPVVRPPRDDRMAALRANQKEIQSRWSKLQQLWATKHKVIDLEAADAFNASGKQELLGNSSANIPTLEKVSESQLEEMWGKNELSSEEEEEIEQERKEQSMAEFMGDLNATFEEFEAAAAEFSAESTPIDARTKQVFSPDLTLSFPNVQQPVRLLGDTLAQMQKPNDQQPNFPQAFTNGEIADPSAAFSSPPLLSFDDTLAEMDPVKKQAPPLAKKPPPVPAKPKMKRVDSCIDQTNVVSGKRGLQPKKHHCCET